MGEARRQGTTTGHVRCDIRKSFDRLVVDPAIVGFGAAAAPSVESWCDKERLWGTVGDVMGRNVYRFAAADDYSNSATIQRASQTTRGNQGSYLHGSLPCTQWTSWQRLNFHLSNPKPGHTTGRSARGGARRGGEAGWGWVERDAVGSIRPGGNPPSCPPANRRHCPGRHFGSTNKRNPMQTDGGTKSAVDQRLTRG